MKVRKKFKFKRLLFSFIFSVFLVSNCLMSHAGQELIKDHTFSASSEDETKDDLFAETIVEDGKTYTLEGVTYTVVSKTPVIEERKLEKVIESDYVTDIENYTPEQVITENDVSYTFVKMESMGESAVHTQEVTAYTDYDYEVTSNNVAQQKTVSATSNMSGKTQYVTCNLAGVSQLDEGTWVSSYIDITFVNYNADVFEWRGHQISKSDAPYLSGYESDILNSVGLDSENCRITNIEWSSGEYQNNGVVQRDARATLQKFVNYYRASYSGTLKETQGTKYQLTYEGVETIESETDFQYEIKATAVYNYEIPKTPVLQYVMAGAGILLVIGLIIALIYVLAKKRNKNKEEQE